MKKLLIWDSETDPPNGDWIVVLWKNRSYNPKCLKTISIQDKVEENAHELRTCYINWIDSLGRYSISGHSVTEHFLLRSGLSYWWMGSLAQKFNCSESSKINDSIKALALEKVINDEKPCQISILSNDRLLNKCIAELCRELNISLEGSKKNNCDSTMFDCAAKFKHSIKAIGYLLLHIQKNFLSILLTKKHVFEETDVLFVDIFTHLQANSLKMGIFHSNYWGGLVDVVQEMSLRNSWLHIYFKHKSVPNLKKAYSIVKSFNKNRKQKHYMLEGFSSISGIVSSLINFKRIYVAERKTRSISKLKPIGSKVNLWLFHKDDWLDSTCGKQAMTNCIRASQMDFAICRHKKIKIGFYLSENQPWEMALIHAWQRAGHGLLIGIIHSTLRFWDLRYYQGKATIDKSQWGLAPFPNYFAANGPYMEKMLKESGYDINKIMALEALRFIHISSSGILNSIENIKVDNVNILICADFSIKNTLLMLTMIKKVQSKLKCEVKFTFKPHPAYNLENSILSAFDFKISDTPLLKLLSECQIMIAANTTSASVEAYILGKRVVQIVGPDELNTSPLRAIDGVMFARTAEELLFAINKQLSDGDLKPERYFYLDETLPRWRFLLSQECKN